MLIPAATFTDPWASLAVSGVKTLETRTGSIFARYTGPLVVHRSLAPPTPYDMSQWGITLPVPRPTGWPEDDRGLALGVVWVEPAFKAEAHESQEYIQYLQRRACFVDIGGRTLNKLPRAAWFPEPIKAAGHQYRFSIDVPLNFLPDWARP